MMIDSQTSKSKANSTKSCRLSIRARQTPLNVTHPSIRLSISSNFSAQLSACSHVWIGADMLEFGGIRAFSFLIPATLDPTPCPPGSLTHSTNVYNNVQSIRWGVEDLRSRAFARSSDTARVRDRDRIRSVSDQHRSFVRYPAQPRLCGWIDDGD